MGYRVITAGGISKSKSANLDMITNEMNQKNRSKLWDWLTPMDDNFQTFQSSLLWENRFLL